MTKAAPGDSFICAPLLKAIAEEPSEVLIEIGLRKVVAAGGQDSSVHFQHGGSANVAVTGPHEQLLIPYGQIIRTH